MRNKSFKIDSPFASDIQGSDLEVDADGGDVVASERVVGEPDQQRALANAGVTDDEKLEHIVVVFSVRRHFFLF